MKEQKLEKPITRPMLNRIIEIHKKIFSGCFPNTTELANDLEVTVSTVSRDIEYLREHFFAPIAYNAKYRGYYYKSAFDLPVNNIAIKDLQTLTFAKMLLSQYKGMPIYKDICDVIDLLNLNNSPSPDFTIMKRIALPPTPIGFVNEENWSKICTALRNNFILEFDYNGRWNTQTTHRRVHPYQLLLNDGAYFVFGFSQERNDERSFNISRMRNIIVTNEVFELPEDYEFENRCGGGKFGAFEAGEVAHYKIRFYNDATLYVKDYVWAKDQKIVDIDENTIEITFSSTQYMKILEWILQQGCNAKPLEPKELVDQWKLQITEMLKMI